MPGPKSYFLPGYGYINETRNSSFFIPGWNYVNEQKFFLAALALTQPAASTALTLKEKFRQALALTAPASSATINGTTGQSTRPGFVSLHDAMQGGLLTASDQAKNGLSLTDTALYDVHLTESVQ